MSFLEYCACASVPLIVLIICGFFLSIDNMKKE